MATKTFKIGLNATDKQNMADDVYERLIAMCFDEYDSSNTYNEGDFVVYEDVLYKCLEDNITGTWDATKWVQATFQDLVDDVEDAVSFVNDKANVDGNYPTMTVGLADNLTPYGDNSGADDDTPFVFQTSGGSRDVSTVAQLRELRGNTIAFNQLCDDNLTAVTVYGYTASITNGVVSITKNSGGDYGNLLIFSTTLISGHTYLFKCSAPNYANINLSTQANNPYYFNANTITKLNATPTNRCILRINSSTSDVDWAVGTTITFRVQLFDLTLMGLDSITNVVDFNRLFPLPYYGYNAGQLLNSQSNGYKIVGYNAFDGEIDTDNGYLQDDGEINGSLNYGISDFIKVIAGQTYTIESVTGYNPSICFYDAGQNFISGTKYDLGSVGSKDVVVPDNALYCKISIYKQNIDTCCFHLTWDGSKTGYEPYYSETYSLPNVELKSAGSVYDELQPNGHKIVRVGSVDLGTLTWGLDSNNRVYTTALQNVIKTALSTEKANLTCSKYVVDTQYNMNLNVNDNTIGTYQNGNVAIYSTSLSGLTAEQVKSALSGVYLYYELATPTEEDTANTFAESTKIDDFGTQEFISTASIVVPQGNYFFYPVDYKAFIDSLGGREDIDYDASEIVSHAELSASEDDRDEADSQLKDAIGGTLRQLLAITQTIDFKNTNYLDLGTLTWGYYDGRFTASAISGMEYPSGYSVVASCLCSAYRTLSANASIGADNDKAIAVYPDGNIFIKDSEKGTDATQFKKAMKNVLLAYKKA